MRHQSDETLAEPDLKWGQSKHEVFNRTHECGFFHITRAIKMERGPHTLDHRTRQPAPIWPYLPLFGRGTEAPHSPKVSCANNTIGRPRPRTLFSHRYGSAELLCCKISIWHPQKLKRFHHQFQKSFHYNLPVCLHKSASTDGFRLSPGS